MKVIIFADSNVGFKILEFIVKFYLKDIACVVLKKNLNIKKLCTQNNIQYYNYTSRLDMLQIMRRHQVELGVLAWWPHIISQDILKCVKFGFINVHNSYLPNHKGKNPYFWAILNQEKYGVTLHKVDEGIDTGEIIDQKEIPYCWEDTAGSLYHKSLNEVLDLFKYNYPKIRLGKVKSKKQHKNGSFHFKKDMEKYSEIFLEKNYEAKYLFNLLRAKTSNSVFPSCFFKDGGNIYGVKISINKIK